MTSCCPSGVSSMISGKNLAHLAWSEAVIEDKIWNKHKSFGSWEMQVKIVFSYSPRVSSSFAFNPSEQCQNRNLPQNTDKHRKWFGPPKQSYIIGFLLSNITDFAKHLSHTVPPATDSMQRGRLRPQWPWRRWRSCWAGVFFCHQNTKSCKTGPMPFSYTVYNYSVYKYVYTQF